MSDETILLPCPFCGSEARMLGTKERWFNPACSNSECGCEWTDSYVTEAEAIAAWNTRATHGTLTAELVEKIVDRNCEWYEGGEIDAQAIVDELNTAMGNPINEATGKPFDFSKLANRLDKDATLGSGKKLITIALQLVRDHYCYPEQFDESCIELERWCYDHGETDLMEYAMALRCPACAFVPMDDGRSTSHER